MTISTGRWRFIFWTSLIAILFLALMPAGPEMPTTGWDKLNHLLAFAVLAVLGRRGYPGRKPAVFIGLLFYAGLIEVLQSFTPYRFAEWADLFADGLGLIIGWGLDGLFRKLIPQAAR
ncbi:VanZ family protein [Methylomicrobium lacus]|uniref:VanZ family protein n=1 Tax=Methylomicrobium lacus TaxID=136992 RepID=UPI0035A85720